MALTIQASVSCPVGADGLPLNRYTVGMEDQRSGSDGLFVENRDLSGPRDQALMLPRLTANAGVLTGTIGGPAIISADEGG